MGAKCPTIKLIVTSEPYNAMQKDRETADKVRVNVFHVAVHFVYSFLAAKATRIRDSDNENPLR